MERKREQGRFVREDGNTEPKQRALRAPQPAQCRAFVLKRIAEAMPELIAKLIEESKKGSCQHMSLLVRLAGLHVREGAKGKGKTRRRGNSTMARMMRELLDGDAVAGLKEGKENAESAEGVEVSQRAAPDEGHQPIHGLEDDRI